MAPVGSESTVAEGRHGVAWQSRWQEPDSESAYLEPRARREKTNQK